MLFKTVEKRTYILIKIRSSWQWISGITCGLVTLSGVSNIWAVQNSLSKLFKLIPNATGSSDVKKDTTNGWSAGKTLRYPGGSGAPDPEEPALIII